jgi:hypothetical protein
LPDRPELQQGRQEQRVRPAQAPVLPEQAQVQLAPQEQVPVRPALLEPGQVRRAQARALPAQAPAQREPPAVPMLLEAFPFFARSPRRR